MNEELRLEAERLSKLRLSDWDSDFIDSIKNLLGKNKELTNRQLNKMNEIIRKYPRVKILDKTNFEPQTKEKREMSAGGVEGFIKPRTEYRSFKKRY